MHIALVHFYSRPTPVYAEIAAALRARGHTVWIGELNEAGDFAWHDEKGVVATQKGPLLLPHFLFHRARRLTLFLRQIFFFAFMLRVRRFLKRHQPDVVQLNTSSVHWLWLPVLFMPSHMRFVLDFRQVGQREATGFLGRLRDQLDNWQRRLYCKHIFDRACFLHQAGAKVVLGKEWQRWGSIVPLGVAEQFLHLDHGHAETKRGEGPVRFLYLGRLSKVRQLAHIIRSVQQVSAVTREFRVHFIGPDVANRYYHNLVNELQLESVITIKPPVPYEDVPAVISSYDVALAYVPDRPAHWRYHPTLKVMEYRALGVPIIASDNEPNRDFVENEINGLLVENTVESLAEGMLRFIRNSDFLGRCRQNARSMRQATTWSQVAEKYERQIYLPLLNSVHSKNQLIEEMCLED